MATRVSTPAVIHTATTLVEFERETDGLIGRASGLGGLLAAYRRSREQLDALSSVERRSVRTAACEAATARGADNDGHRRLVFSGDQVQHRVSSEAVRRASVELWQACRSESWALTAQPGQLWLSAVLPLFSARTVADVVTSLRTDTLIRRRADETVTAARLALIDVYRAREAAVGGDGWSGARMVTADGWTIGYQRQQRFSAAVCRERADEYGVDWRRYTRPVIVGGSWRAVPIDGDHHGADDGGDQYAQ